MTHTDLGYSGLMLAESSDVLAGSQRADPGFM